MEYLSLKEAAELFKVSTRTIRRWCNLGLPYAQITERGRVVIPKLKAIAWVNSHAFPSVIKIKNMRR